MPRLKRSLLVCIGLLACSLIAGVAPARADESEGAAASALQARIDEAARAMEDDPSDETARAMEDDPQTKTTSFAQRRSLVEFVTGSMFFILQHEMGHVHISEMALSVLGREEDSADTFAAVTLLQIRTALSHRMLVDAAKSWFLSALRDEKEKTPLAFYDDHGLDRQRAYWIVCLMVGSDPPRFKDLADETRLPADQRDNCVGDHSNASWSWKTALEPHRRRPDQPKTTINVVYAPEKDERRVYERAFRAMRLLETVAEHAADEWVWRAPFTIEARNCDEPNSQWNLPTRTLTLCYEMAADFARLYRGYGSDRMLPQQFYAARHRRNGTPAAR